MIGARFYTQLDSAQLRSDVVENELTKVNTHRLVLSVSEGPLCDAVLVEYRNRKLIYSVSMIN
jgi:hypothetical protein